MAERRRMKNTCLLAIIVVIVLMTGTRSRGQDNSLVTPPKARQIDGLFSTWDSTASPGCALGVSHDGNIVYERGYGMASLEYGLAIQPNSIFDVGSVAKQFTAFAILLLAEEKKLQLDDDIRHSLPELSVFEHTITIRHLLTHTSGLRDFFDLTFLGPGRPEDVRTESSIMQLLARQKASNFAAGTEYLYGNTDYALLAMIVKRVSGQSLREFTDARIFVPLGMRDTHFIDDPTLIVRRRVSSYQPRNGAGYRIADAAIDAVGPAGLLTSVGDLLAWQRNLDDAKVGGRRVVDQMQQPARLANGTEVQYGMGLDVDTYRGSRMIGHDGADGGYRADVIRFPSRRLSIAVLCNLSSTRPRALALRTAEIILGADILAPAILGEPLPEAVTTPLTGAYWNPVTDDVLWVTAKDGHLMKGGDVLVPLGDGQFRVGDGSNTFVFPVPRTGAPQELQTASLAYWHGMAPATFVQVTPKPEPQLRDYVGNFYSDEIDVTYTFRLRSDGKLEVVQGGTEAVVLDMIKPDTFGNIGITTFTRAPSGEVTGFTISTGRVRRLLFRRIAAPTPAGSIVK